VRIERNAHTLSLSLKNRFSKKRGEAGGGGGGYGGGGGGGGGGPAGVVSGVKWGEHPRVGNGASIGKAKETLNR